MAELQHPCKKVLTESELAAELGLSAWTIRRWRLNEGLPVIKLGGRFMYRLESVLAWLASRETSGTASSEADGSGVIREIRL